MQQKTDLYIPTPCHEDWNKMTSTQQGKFCESCNKQVIDFTLMSDQQILNHLSKQAGRLCGRFDAEQLQRPLVETKIKRKKSWWMALMMPVLLLFERSEAQDSPIVPQHPTVSSIDKNPEVMGKLMYRPIHEVTITGKVVDEKNQPIPFATIEQKGTKNQVTADNEGCFSIQVHSYDSVTVLTVACVGFMTTEKLLHLKQHDIGNITLKVQLVEALTGEVVVVGYAIRHNEVRPLDTVKSTIRRILNISGFKIYPNPALKGSVVYLQIKKPGAYQLQLLNNQSELIRVEEINAVSGKTVSSITIPSNIAAGIYYLRIIDEQTKKQYTEKLIIQ